MTIDPDLLAAFADGELDGAERARVEEALAADPGLARQLEAHRALRARLSAHYDPIAAAPLPERLTALLQPANADIVDLASVRGAHAEKRSAPQWRARFAMGGAMAASLAIGIMLSPSIMPQGPIASRNGQLVARGELAGALSNQLASAQGNADKTRILLSFEDHEGRYCRGYEQARTAGIACREGSEWQIIQARSVAPEPRQGEYAQAGSAAAGIMAAAQEMAEGQAFSAEQEKAARAAGWQK